jgi:hypothetical protein
MATKAERAKKLAYLGCMHRFAGYLQVIYEIFDGAT